MHIRGVVVLLALVAGSARARADVTVFLERSGEVTDDGVEIPRFGGGDKAWNAIVSCVREQYSAFAVDIVDQRPTRGRFITAVVGGKASLLGLDDSTTNGVGPYDGNVQLGAIVHIFSRVGTGERDVENLCAVTAHEVGHALGLDHEVYCGDVMSYYLDRCGARRFIDADAPCGEHSSRECGSGEASQNSYRRLGELVGFRDGRRDPNPAQRQRPDSDPWSTTDDNPTDDSATGATDGATDDAASSDDPQPEEAGADATPQDPAADDGDVAQPANPYVGGTRHHHPGGGAHHTARPEDPYRGHADEVDPRVARRHHHRRHHERTRAHHANERN